MKSRFLLKVLFVSLVVVFISGCGYKPSAKFSREIVGNKISTSVVISAQDPENTVIIKDAIDGAILEIFHASLSARSISDTHLAISITNPSYSPIQYDKNGYVIAYRTTIRLKITRYHNGIKKSYSAKGTYDFAIEAHAIVTDQERFLAIKNSSSKAIKSFIAQVSAEGARAKSKV